MIWTAGEEQRGVRLDAAVVQAFPEVSRSRLQQLFREGALLLEGSIPQKLGIRLKPGMTVSLTIPEPIPLDLPPSAVPPDQPLDIRYEDRDIIVINKPAGMVVHPSAGHRDDTLVNALLSHCTDLSGINGVMRPGIVHRLDRDTTGLLVVAKNDEAHRSLARQIADRSMSRQYVALVHHGFGDDAQTGVLDFPLDRHPKDRKKRAVVFAGRPAVTHYEVLEQFGAYALVKARLETGRTHQIRVHFAHINHPVVGDPLYGPAQPPFHLEYQLLHAGWLRFCHPRTGQEMSFSAPLPARFAEVLSMLNSYWYDNAAEMHPVSGDIKEGEDTL